jgi:hypothetical protein
VLVTIGHVIASSFRLDDHEGQRRQVRIRAQDTDRRSTCERRLADIGTRRPHVRTERDLNANRVDRRTAIRCERQPRRRDRSCVGTGGRRCRQRQEVATGNDSEQQESPHASRWLHRARHHPSAQAVRDLAAKCAARRLLFSRA